MHLTVIRNAIGKDHARWWCRLFGILERRTTCYIVAMRPVSSSVDVGEGVHLHVVRSIPDSGNTPARVLIVHGLGEHSGRYDHVVGALVQRGCEVWRYDQRGNGRSGGRRGDVRAYNMWVEDLDRVVAHAGGAEGMFVYAHSFGGQVALKWILDHRPPLAGLILSAPWLRLAMEPPRWKLRVAALAATLWPQMRLSTGVSGELLSSDADFLRGLDPDGLIHRTISVRTYHSAMRVGAEVLGRAGEVETPLLLVQGTGDRIISPSGSAEFVERCGARDKRLWLVEGARHEAHNEVGRGEVVREIGNWILERAVARGGATSALRSSP